MPDKKRISGYLPEAEHERVERRAEANDQSISEFVVDAVREKIDHDDLGSAAQQYRIEERLLSLVDEATTEAADQAADRITERVLEALEARGQPAPDDTGADSDSTRKGGDIVDFS